MRIVHMADSHLGFQNYGRVDKKGRNLMEEMVYDGFDQTVDRIIELDPDAVVHAGDVFHHVRPRIRPLYVFKQGLERLADAGIPVVVISGNHDAPKGYSAISPFYIYEGTPGVHIAHRYRYEPFEIGDHTFHCIPFCLDPSDYLEEFRKIDRTGADVLVMHGLVEALRNRRLMTVGEHEIGDGLLKEDMDYIALGHFHGQAQVGRNAWYSGSVEYFNFGEAGDEKGILHVDLDTGEVEQVKVRPGYMVDQPPLDCGGLSSGEIVEEIEAVCSNAGKRIVRVNLVNVDKAAYRSMDRNRLQRLHSSVLYLKVRAKYSDDGRGPEAPAQVDALCLPEEFRSFLGTVGDEVPGAIRGEVMAYGTELIHGAVKAQNTEALDAPE